MAKVIVERPRHGGGVKYPRGSARTTDRVAPEDWRRRESMKSPWERSSCEKMLNENLAPLRRYLRSNVGRPWDKVYADVCQRINRNSAVQLHIWQHLVDYVCTNPLVIRGQVSCYGQALSLFDFYVHPDTGRLCVNEDAFRRRYGNPKPEVRLPGNQVMSDRGRHYRRIGAVWFEVKFAPVPDCLDGLYDALLEKRGDELTRELLRRVYPSETYHRDVYCYARRQLTEREIRRLIAVRDERVREAAERCSGFYSLPRYSGGGRGRGSVR